jgi:hypothetical protein
LTKSLGSSQPGLSNAKVVTVQEIHGARTAFVCGICRVDRKSAKSLLRVLFIALLVVSGFRTNKYRKLTVVRTANTQYRKFETNIPRKGIAPKS